MWTDAQKQYCRQVAALYGASGFHLQLDGTLLAVTDNGNFVVSGEHVYFGPSDAQLAANALAAASGTTAAPVGPQAPIL